MKLFKRSRPDTTPPRSSDHAQRLAGVRGLARVEDERPSREDADYGQTIFTRPLAGLPRSRS